MTTTKHLPQVRLEHRFDTAAGLELKAPPAALTMVAAALMWLASLAAPAFDFNLPANVPAVALVLAGAATCLAGVASFRRARTTVNPLKPDSASALVVSGIYNHSRNPMYLGFLLILAGWAVYLSNGLAILFLPAFVLYVNRFQIRPEERALAALFSRRYEEYCGTVSRWL